MKVLLLALTLAVAATAWGAKTADPCVVQKIKLQEAELSSANIANINTTSTEDGGPYKRKVLKCRNNDCAVVSEAKVVRKYMPEHPDSDINGFVNFPKIDLAGETRNLNAATEAYYSAKARCE